MLTFCICNCLIRYKSLKLLCENISFMTRTLRLQSRISKLIKENESLKFPDSTKYTLEGDFILASKLFQEHQKPETIQWNEVLNKLKELNVKNPHLALLQFFIKSKKINLGVSLYNYLNKEGNQFTVLENLNYLKLFSSDKSLILENEAMVTNLYENIKDYLLQSHALRDLVLDVIGEVPYCFYDFVNIARENNIEYNKSTLANKAFKFDNVDLALNIMKERKTLHVPSDFNNAYLCYLDRMAQNNKLTPDMISTFTNFYECNITALDVKNLPAFFEKIVKNANKHKGKYTWSVKSCKLDFNYICTNCMNKLIEKPITETEFSHIKKDFLSQVALLYKNVFLSTSNSELQKFFSFLDNCQPYSIVIDALNVIYMKKFCGVKNLTRLTKHLLKEGHSILVTGREHAKRSIMKAVLLNKKSHSKIQFFFPSNLSDDDVFFLYATLQGGLGTHFISADQFSNYFARLNPDQKLLFLKWRLYHQYVYNGVDLIPPLRHLGVPQLTCTPGENGKKFIWHISYSLGVSTVNCFTPLKWVCLQVEEN